MRDASICVQSVLRAAVQAKKIAAMISAAIVLQSCARNYMKRKGEEGIYVGSGVEMFITVSRSKE